jgi:hypothetical protein
MISILDPQMCVALLLLRFLMNISSVYLRLG